MTNVLQGVTAKLERLPRNVIDDATRRFIDIAEHEGGRVAGHQLTAEAHQRHVTDGTGAVTMVGTPARFWAWRERGTRAHLIRAHTHEPLALSGHPVWGPVHHPGTEGRHAWTNTCERAAREIGPLVERALGALT